MNYQRWSPRGHSLKSLALASKPQVFENCPVLGSRTTLFSNRWNFIGKRQKPCGKSVKTFFLVSSSRDCPKKNFWRPLSPEKKFWRPFFEIAWKNFWRPFFFWEHLRLCPWSLALASRGSVLGLESFLCSWPWPRALCPRLHLCELCE